MAKGKQAAALFEVIHGANRERSSETKLDTPKWWFKSKKRDVDVHARPDAAPARPVPAVLRTSPVAAPRALEPAGPATHAAPPMSMPRERMADSHERKDGRRVPLPSSHAVATGLVLAAVLGVGFVAGQRFRHGVGSAGSSPVIAEQTTEELRAGEAHPEVLDLARAKPTLAAQPSDPNDPAPIVANLASPAAKPSPTWNDPRPPSTFVVQSKQRVIGLNYVIVQSYPDESGAQKAVDALAKDGIQTTIVKGPPGWAANTWFSVVGTTGFDKIRNSPEFDAYCKAIDRVGAKFAGTSKFKRFEPRAYKWKVAEPVANSR